MSAKPEPTPTSDPGATTAERRRTGIIVHDDRGNGRLEWVDVPPAVERTTLSVEESRPVCRPERGYDPYGKTAGAPRKEPGDETGQTSRRDLRQLSEWIKQMRRLEEWKRAEAAEAEGAQAPAAKSDADPRGDG